MCSMRVCVCVVFAHLHCVALFSLLEREWIPLWLCLDLLLLKTLAQTLDRLIECRECVQSDYYHVLLFLEC